MGTALFGFMDTSRSQHLDAADQRYLTFDFHCHPGRFHRRGLTDYEGDVAILKTILAMNASHLSGAMFSLVADTLIIKPGPTGVSVERPYAPGEAWKEYQRQLISMKDFFQGADVRLSTRASDLANFAKQDKVAAFIACEGGDFLEGRSERLGQVYQDGVRSIQLVHYAQNDIGDLQTENSFHNGLSKFGKEVVQKMNVLGMVIDVAHASYKTTKDVADASRKPIILSHSILAMEADRPIAKRAITPDHAKVVAQTGGVIGCWPSGFNKSFSEFVDNTLRMVDVAGIDHVGLGTDMDSNFKPVLDNYAQLPEWADALKAKGLSDGEVQKLLGGNALRVLNQIL